MSLPLLSSRQIIQVLERIGFRPARAPKGSHQAFERKQEGRTRVVIVKVGAREVPKGTLRSILRQAGLSENELRRYLER